jgi:uncharacterized RDD family membrane protein YckC
MFDAKAVEPSQTAFAFGDSRNPDARRVLSIAEFRTTPPNSGLKAASKSRERPPRPHSGGMQERIDFDTGATPARRVNVAYAVPRTKPEAAAPFRRIVAGFADLAVIGLLLVPIAIVTQSAFGHEWLNGRIKEFYAGVGAVLLTLYKLAWASVDEDSFGVRLCGLKLVNYDNRLPNQRQRMVRIAWAILSVLPGGIGLIWCLVEEDKLTWHDISTRTYLSPVR